MLGNDKKVILVTSTVSGEGKSFISGNLAISLSLLGVQPDEGAENMCGLHKTV